MDKFFNMAPGTGVYYIIRSSKDRLAMIGWDTLHYDHNSGKWFEWIRCEFSTSDEGTKLLRKDENKLRVFRRANLDRCAQESVLEITAGIKGKVWSCLQVSVEEFRSYERREVGFIIDEFTAEQLKDAMKFVKQWHYDSETRYPHIYYKSFRPFYEWEVDPISVHPDSVFAESE